MRGAFIRAVPRPRLATSENGRYVIYARPPTAKPPGERSVDDITPVLSHGRLKLGFLPWHRARLWLERRGKI